MKKYFLVLLALPLLWSCGDNNNSDISGTPKLSQNQQTDLNSKSATSLADSFCSHQTNLQILSTSLLSAFSVKDNSPDLNYCGGSIALNEDGLDFDVSINDYCVTARGQDVILNGSIVGTIESGANFTSDIPNISIVGDGIDLSVSGNTWDGRADDMFISLSILDNINATELLIDEVSIKKGELDFGYITFPDLGRFEFKFIEHFNAELTQGQLFIYGAAEEITIISADNGSLTVVYKESKLDPGVSLDSSCGS